jgi:hypothetical protein
MKFDVRKYKDDGYALIDGSDALANNGQVISVRNERNGSAVYFKAFITTFNDTFSPNYTPTEVFGRTDPIYQYKNTTRTITLAWKLPAASESEAFENLEKVQDFLQMLYPSYTDANNALTLSETPLVRIKVMNLMQKSTSNRKTGNLGSGTDATDAFNEYITTNNSSRGLLGVITSCNVNYNLEGTDGVFEKRLGPDGGEGARTTILPKLIDINISFSPLHEKTLGYGSDSSISGFPYGLTNKKSDNFMDDVSVGFVDRRPGGRFSGPPELSEQKIPLSPQPRGKSLEELKAIKNTLEEKRRAAASAQQKADKAKAAARRAMRRMRKGKKLNERQGQKFDDRQEAVLEAMDADRDLILYESSGEGQYEDLLG